MLIMSIVALILMSMSFILPKEYGYENHIFENIELVILILGIIVSIYKLVHYTIIESIKFYISLILIYILMLGREINWGRIFYPVKVLPDGDTIYISLDKLWYGQIVYPSIAVLVGISLIILGYFIYESKLKNIQWNMPIEASSMFLVMSLLSQCVFELEYVNFISNYNQLLEEICEMMSYAALVYCSYQIDFCKFYTKIKYFDMIKSRL